MASAIAIASRGGNVASSSPATTSTGVLMPANNARWSGRAGTTLFTAHEAEAILTDFPAERNMCHNVGTLPKGRWPQESLEHRSDQHRSELSLPSRKPEQHCELNLLADAGPAGGAVHQDRPADPVRMGRGERRADHAAPRVADEVSSFNAEPVEDVDNTASAIAEREHVCQGLTSALARRVDQDHLRAPDEIIGHPMPHVAGHQQTRPEHDRGARSTDLHPHLSQHGVHRPLAKLIADAGHPAPRYRQRSASSRGVTNTSTRAPLRHTVISIRRAIASSTISR